MCGIAGIISRLKTQSQKSEIVQLLCKSMQFRGPDFEGVEHLKYACFGHRRLSIIDTSENAKQPFLDRQENLMLVVNGEIYNYKELRQELQKCGCCFQSQSDSEVILQGFSKWGEAIFKKLRGMFAIALFDGKTETIYLVRDRQGIKPLCYTFFNGDLVFASDLRSLLKIPGITRKLNPDSLRRYLLYGYVPQNLEFVQGIQYLEPGHVLKINDFQHELFSYWEIGKTQSCYKDDQECLERTRELLLESMKLHLQSDVPLGIFLSGGIDSTAILAMANNMTSGVVKTFSIGFQDGDSKLNELHMAKKIASHFGTKHVEYVMTGHDVRERLDRIIEAQALPSFDGINTYLVSEMASKEGLRVALSGLGGDELFGGYGIFDFVPKVYPKIKFFLSAPRGLKCSMALLGQTFLGPKSIRLKDVNGFVDFYAMIRANGWTSDTAKILSDRFRQTFGHQSSPWKNLEMIPLMGNVWTDLQLLEMKNYMSWRLLQDTDSMSMANSLEVRVPLIDDALVEHVFSLPNSIKKRYGFPKKLLVESVRALLPDFVIGRPKQGFALPMKQWMLGELNEVVQKSLSRERIEKMGLFDCDELNRCYKSFVEGKIPYEFFWKYVALDLWMEKHNVEIY